MLELRPATPEMAREIPLSAAQLILTGDIFEHDVSNAIAAGLAIAIYNDDLLIGIFGLANQGGGRYIGWAACTERLRKHMISVIRIIKNCLWEYNGSRIEAHVPAGYQAGEKFARVLGFQLEGVMTRFNNGLDFGLWARCW